MSSSTAAKVAQRKPKKKCCRSEPRCLSCPVVVARMKKLQQSGAGDKQLKKELKKARRA